MYCAHSSATGTTPGSVAGPTAGATRVSAFVSACPAPPHTRPSAPYSTAVHSAAPARCGSE